jgi:hypothetical protein
MGHCCRIFTPVQPVYPAASVRDFLSGALNSEYSSHATRLAKLADDAYIAALAEAVTGRLGGKVGVAPRIFLKKLVAEVLDRIDQFPDFDPRQHYALTLTDGELNDTERHLVAVQSVDEIEL